MKKILIALDYGPTAQKVAEDGYALAKAMTANVVLLHVVADAVYYSSIAYAPIMGFGGYSNIDYLQPDIADSLKKASQLFLATSKVHLGDDTIQTVVKNGGDTADSITAVAEELNADIIVMGTHSRKWLELIVMGSVTENVLKHTSKPLFIIPVKN